MPESWKITLAVMIQKATYQSCCRPSWRGVLTFSGRKVCRTDMYKVEWWCLSINFLRIPCTVVLHLPIINKPLSHIAPPAGLCHHRQALGTDLCHNKIAQCLVHMPHKALQDTCHIPILQVIQHIHRCSKVVWETYMIIKFLVRCLAILLIIMLIILDMAQVTTTYTWCTG